MAVDVARDELIERVIASAGAELDDVASERTFLHQYYERAAPDDLADRPGIELYAAAMAHRKLGEVRGAGTAAVRLYQPTQDADGWQSNRHVLDIVTDDMPFLVDSVVMELGRQGLPVQFVVHPVLRIERDGDGRMRDILPPSGLNQGRPESFLHIELDPTTSSTPDDVRAGVVRVLDDVRSAVDDWARMRRQAEQLAVQIESERLPVDRDEREEAAALLRWMIAERFTFLGYREYDLVSEGDATLLTAVPGSGLGILRQEEGVPTPPTELSPVVAARAREPVLLNLTKANARATIHRPTHLDYVGVKKFDDHGHVTGERRFLGLYTSAAYNSSAFDVPVLRRKATAVVVEAGFPRGGHSTRKLVDIIETYPRDELFQISTEQLYENAIGILRLQDRSRVKLFRRVDPFERFVSCLVYVPRDRYTTAVRERMRDILSDAHDAVSIDYTARITESPLARLHFVVRTTPGAIPPFVPGVVEERLAAAARSWVDDLRAALVDGSDGQRGRELFDSYGNGFPAAYREDFSITTATADIRQLDALRPDGDLRLSLYRPHGAAANVLRLKMYRSGDRISLSDVLPVLEHLGVTVVDERPYTILLSDHPARPPRAIPDGGVRWIYDFGLQLSDAASRTVDRNRDSFLDALAAAWRGDVDNDGFNQLVLEAGLEWRQVVVLRAYRKYLRQTGSTFSQSYIERVLAARPELVRLLMALFDARFNPDRPFVADDEHHALGAEAGDVLAFTSSEVSESRVPRSRQRDIDALALQVEVALELIENLDEDRIFRGFFRLIQATTRTNFYQSTSDGKPKPYVALKLDPRALPDLPEPRPKHEIFVHSPRVEGAHLRGGDVARGGLRWSDRPEDFRTEILGLMKAQLVKNSVIVPLGAKGGFVVKRPPATGDRENLLAEGVACYRDFISALLDVTDNLVEGHAVRPERVVAHDGDDTYLVVAADKGTATFSDIANELAVARGFWLGDAFASGGSAGYDHKAMGITARGAWESVKRHFRELGVDVQRTDFTVAGIGDMSGDVFGNGMLLSPHIRLVAAFDHRHVFLDPDPDAAAAFGERRRLFELPRSSWDDYERSLISTGGGVFPRTAKSIPLSPEARAALGVAHDHLPPPDLIRAILLAPVDLLWNGGVGTYVKARAESNADVGDKTNDVVRVDGGDLRCRVVGEGGNLGFTQRARVEYALTGGRIYTDAIDNSAGVDCSDHEVNIKILLDGVVRRGDLTTEDRNQVLATMTDEVGAQVVHDNYAHTQALAIAKAQAPSLVDVHGRYIAALEQRGRLDRALEFLPSDEEMTQRRATGQGLTTPELAILLAYTKVTLDRDIVKSDLPEDPYLSATLAAYFPRPLREPYAKEIQHHPLRREIIATCVSNVVINRGGTSFLHRLADETHALPADIARCHLASAAIFGMPALWARIEALDNEVPAETQTRMLLSSRRLVERATRWLLQNRRSPLDISSTVWSYANAVAKLAEQLPAVLVGTDRDRRGAVADELASEGVPADLAATVAGLDAMAAALDVADVAEESGHDVVEVAAVYFALGNQLRFDWLRDQIVALSRDDRWRTLARASLRGDLFARHRTITAEIMRVSPARDASDVATAFDPEWLIEQWLDAHEPIVKRFRDLIGDISSSDSAPDLAVLSVALRVVQDLAEG